MKAQNGLKFPSELCFGIMNVTKYSYLLNSKVAFLKSDLFSTVECQYRCFIDFLVLQAIWAQPHQATMLVRFVNLRLINIFRTALYFQQICATVPSPKSFKGRANKTQYLLIIVYDIKGNNFIQIQ